MYNTSNPAELYAGTTWELLPDNKFLKTGSTPLQQAGNNSLKITKANLPADKLQVESHSMTRGTMNITGVLFGGNRNGTSYVTGAFTQRSSSPNAWGGGGEGSFINFLADFNASKTWSGNTSSASPYTSAMGSGTPLTINPEHITVKAWKRLT